MVVTLKHFQDAAGVVTLTSGVEPFVEHEGEFDEVGEAASASPEAESHRLTRIRDGTNVEREVLTLPSNGNVGGDAIQLEIEHRIQQAHRQVTRLRDIIADVSFQYSHVIRGATRKSVRATAQKRIKSLQNDIILHARIYTRCRSRLVALKCDEQWLKIFRLLNRSDLKASTAILDPNTPGSSSVNLSWIWRTGRWYSLNSGADIAHYGAPDPASLLECLWIFS